MCILFYFSGETFCLRRDSCFYSCQWRDVFYLARPFFVWCDLGATFVYLARLFFYSARPCLFGATFFLATGSNRFPIGHFGKYHSTLCLSPQILHKHCFQFLLGLTVVPRENKNNAYAKFGGTNKEY